MNQSVNESINNMIKHDAALRNEHEGLRNRVGFYDFTHQLLEVTGSDAAAFLDKMFINTIANINVGSAKYTTMLNENAEIIDDVIVFRMAQEKYWVSTLYIAEMIQWFDTHSAGQAVSYQDITAETSMYAIQGPRSKDVLNAFLGESIDDLKFFTIVDNSIGEIPVKVARCGFTGELGYEIYISPEHKELLEEKLNQSGQEHGIVKMTTDVILTSIPSEKGFVLMKDVTGINPLEANYGWLVDWDTDFIGKAVLEQAKAEGVKRQLVGFTVEDAAAQVAEQAVVKANGETAGKVTNFTYGFTVEKNIGYALIDQNIAKIGDKVTIESEGKEIEATLTERCFYDIEAAILKA
ncbi:aminomethyltransferase family protein [Oceanisphaera sp.]|uniref:aminomethyltransferase family protein n=1 Tax=Oceanisphaera sp. TaxID=1929979 RepID=UPI003A926A24